MTDYTSRTAAGQGWLWAALAAEIVAMALFFVAGAVHTEQDPARSDRYKVRIAAAAQLAEQAGGKAEARLTELAADDHPLVRRVASEARLARSTD